MLFHFLSLYLSILHLSHSLSLSHIAITPFSPTIKCNCTLSIRSAITPLPRPPPFPFLLSSSDPLVGDSFAFSLSLSSSASVLIFCSGLLQLQPYYQVSSKPKSYTGKPLSSHQTVVSWHQLSPKSDLKTPLSRAFQLRWTPYILVLENLGVENLKL